MLTQFTRREFLATSAAAGSALLGAPAILSAQTKGDRLRVAFIGVGGINRRHVADTAGHGDICAAYCDTDTTCWGRIGKTIAGM